MIEIKEKVPAPFSHLRYWPFADMSVPDPKQTFVNLQLYTL